MDRTNPELRWRKSTFSSGTNDCVEVADLPDGQRAVRDSKNPAGGMLSVTAIEWRAFVAGVKSGEIG